MGASAGSVQAEITSAGTADSFLQASHVSRTRRAHQVTAAALSTLQRRAYTTITLSSVMNAMRSWNLMIGASSKQRRAPNLTTGQPSCNWSWRFWCTFALYARDPSRCTWTPGLTWRRGSMRWTTPTTRAGFLFICETWSHCPQLIQK